MSEQNPPIFLQEGSHPAEDVRRWMHHERRGAEGVVDPWVTDTAHLVVTERGAGANMSVDVAAGACYVAGTEGSYQGLYFCESRGTVNVAISAADATLNRYDIIVARVRDSYYSGSTDAWALEVVTGTAAASPSVPATPDNALKLAEVYVGAAVSSIVNANITDKRVAPDDGRIAQAADATKLPPNPATGQMTYLTSTDALMVYSGAKSAWHRVNFGDWYSQSLSGLLYFTGAGSLVVTGSSLWTRLGSTVLWTGGVQVSSSSGSSGFLEMTPPLTIATAWGTSPATRIGTFEIYDSSAALAWGGMNGVTGAGNVNFLWWNNGGAQNSVAYNAPFTWANGDYIYWTVQYEAA